MSTGRRLQIADYERLAEAKGLDWLGGDLPLLDNTSTTWRCRQCGHVFNNSHQYMLRALCPCPQCRKARYGHSPDAYKSLAESRGFAWVGQTVPSRHSSRTEWRCQYGHIWSTSYSAIKEGRACHQCAGIARKTEDDYRAFATQGIFWIGENLPENTHSPTLWRCENGHEWTTKYASIYLGTRCPHCKHKQRRRLKDRHLETDYHQLAERRGFSWLGDALPPNSHRPTSWQCAAGHQWETSFSEIDKGGGCPYCSGVARKREIDYQVLAERQSIAWIGEQLPKNTSTPTTWRCDNGHEFVMSYRSIEPLMTACPECRKAKLRGIADYRALAEKHNLEWLDNSPPENTEAMTTWRCSKGHEFQDSYERIRRRTCACPQCRGHGSADYQALAEKQNLEWLDSKPPVTLKTMTTWRCSKGHEFQASYEQIRRRECACSRCLRRSAADYEALAKSLGWHWIGGSIPRNTHIVTNWRCSQGHTLRMTYSWVARKGVCSVCSGRRRPIAIQRTKMK